MSKEFDPLELKNAVSAVNVAFEEFKKANDARLKELEAKGASDPLLDEKLDKINETIQTSQDRLDKFEVSLKRKNRTVTDANGDEIDFDKKAQEWARGVTGDRRFEFDNEGMCAYKTAFNKYLRKGDQIMGADELKALSVGSDVDGGYTVHPDMSGRIVKKVFETTPMRAYASVQVISTDALEGVFDLNEASAGWVQETGSRSETNTPEIGVWRIPVHEMYAAPQATQKLLDDSSVNMEAWLADKVSDKFSRLESTAFVTGTGVGQPRGFATYANGTTLPGTIEQIKTGANGAFAAAPAGGDVLIDALYALKASYRANAVFAMNRTTFREVRQLKDSNGAYLWQPGIVAGQPATILGRPTASFEDMAAMATGSLSIAVADWREAYQIVDRIGVRTLRDPYSSKPYVIFYSTKRVGGDVVNFEAIKLIDFSA
jgi:HK97 family phage major capsid protein